MTFVCLFKELEQDYKYLHELMDRPFQPSKSRTTLTYRQKPTQRTFISQIPHDTSFRPSIAPQTQQIDNSSSHTGIHLAQIEIALDHQTIQYNIFSDTTAMDITDFIQYNFSPQYSEEMMSIISYEVSKATQKLRLSMQKQSRSRSISQSKKQNQNLFTINKGKKPLKLLYNQKSLTVNLNKLCITHKLSDKQKKQIIRAINRGQRQLIL